MSGKGSRRRPCDEKKVGDNWDKIFKNSRKVDEVTEARIEKAFREGRVVDGREKCFDGGYCGEGGFCARCQIVQGDI